MARLARVVIPGVPHHVTQRGNRRQPVFFSDGDRRLYKRLVGEALGKSGVRCLAWCLMDNHVHLILVPETADGLRAGIAEAHRRYSRAINEREDWRGYLFQGRFASYPMDDAHLMAAVRYVENNPVSAGLVERAEDWRWSSARAHVLGEADGLTDIEALGRHVRDWRRMLAEGLGAADASEAMEVALRTGRPRGAAAWIDEMAARTGRALAPGKRGRKRRREISIVSPN